jgi:hypothetical protein
VYKTKVIRLEDSGYADAIVIGVNGDAVYLQSDLASGTYPLFWTSLRLH